MDLKACPQRRGPFGCPKTGFCFGFFRRLPKCSLTLACGRGVVDRSDHGVGVWAEESGLVRCRDLPLRPWRTQWEAQSPDAGRGEGTHGCRWTGTGRHGVGVVLGFGVQSWTSCSGPSPCSRLSYRHLPRHTPDSATDHCNNGCAVLRPTWQKLVEFLNSLHRMEGTSLVGTVKMKAYHSAWTGSSATLRG